MSGTGQLDIALAGVMLLVAGYHGLRLLSAARLGLAGERQVDLTHLVMGIAMAFMLIRPVQSIAGAALIVLFAVSTLWFAGQSLRLLGTGARWSAMHRAQHCVLCVAMLVMLLNGLDEPMPGMQSAAPDASRLSAVSLLLVGSLLVLSVWNFDQLGQLQANRVGPALGSPIAGRLVPASATAVSCRLAMCLVMSYLIVLSGH